MSIVIEVNGREYDNVVSAVISRSIEDITSAFSVVMTIDDFNTFPFKVQDEVRILVEKKAVLTGFIEELDMSYDKSKHAIQVNGRDKTMDIVDSSIIGPVNLSPKISLKSVIEKVISVNGITGITVIDNVSPELFEEDDIVTSEVGENMFDFIRRYCALRQVVATTDGDGNIVISRGADTRLNARLVHRHTKVDREIVANFTGIVSGSILRSVTRENNILSASVRYSTTDRFNKYIVKSQQNLNALNINGGDITSSSVVSQQGSATDSEVRSSRAMVISGDSSNSVQTAKQKATWEANIRRVKSFEYSCRVAGFLAEENPGVLWQPNRLIQVVDEKAKVDSELLIRSVRYNFNKQDKSTELVLGYKDSYTLNAEQQAVEARSNQFGVGLL